jgi:ABC-type antimicrobial peptide transport system permease subunit
LQFLCETFLLALTAAIISLVIAGPMLKFLQSLIPNGVSLNISDPNLWIFLFLTIVATSLLAGFYPAKVLSAFKPILSLKGQSDKTPGQKGYLRKGLILFQFTFSLIFIVGSIVVGKQIHFLLNKDLGFTKDAIITTWTGNQYPESKKKLLAERIRLLPGVEQLCYSWESPAVDYLRGGNLKCKENGVEIFSEQRDGDENYVPLYGLKILAGRNFQSPVIDSAKETIVNETCSRQLGFKKPEDALGHLVETEFSGAKPFRIVGVIADFHSKSLHESIDPVFIIGTASCQQLSIKLSSVGKQPVNFRNTIATIEKDWREIYPGEKFEYRFLDETISRFYVKEQQTELITDIATTIAILVSCMGLFGLISFIAEQRTREIGIRKVLGARVSEIVVLLSKDFLKLVIIAIFIASPIAWYFMNKWLQNFAFRITMSWWIFALSGICAIAIAILSTSFQSIKAAIANPVKSLRSE